MRAILRRQRIQHFTKSNHRGIIIYKNTHHGRTHTYTKMVQSVNALVVAVLAVATAVVQGLYVQYELFSASDCNAASLVQTGIAAGVGACVVVRTGVVPELNGYASRRFECNSIINYPYHDNCQELTPDEVSPNLPPRKVTAMNTCEKLDDGTTTGTVKYARYTCRSGGFVRIRQASSCNFTGDPQGITADDFYLENGACTPGFNENSAEISQSSDRAIVDGDHVALVSW